METIAGRREESRRKDASPECWSFTKKTLVLLAMILPIAAGGERPEGPAGSTGASRRFLTEFLQEAPAAAGSGPYFDLSVNSNLTGLVGQSVQLLCRVRALGNRTPDLILWLLGLAVCGECFSTNISTAIAGVFFRIDNLDVSWVRHRDIHLLTVGRYTYTSDQRFEALHSPHSEDWALRIRPAQRRDSGAYECQVSTTPPIGHHVFLSVVEPETEILGGPELFINLGSTINLTCLVRHAPEPPAITWAHKDQTINFDSARGGISLVTEKGAASSSRLLVQRARPSDSGSYTCAPSNAPPAHVRVHILNGEHPAAIYGGASRLVSSSITLACFLLSSRSWTSISAALLTLAASIDFETVNFRLAQQPFEDTAKHEIKDHSKHDKDKLFLPIVDIFFSKINKSFTIFKNNASNQLKETYFKDASSYKIKKNLVEIDKDFKRSNTSKR